MRNVILYLILQSTSLAIFPMRLNILILFLTSVQTIDHNLTQFGFNENYEKFLSSSSELYDELFSRRGYKKTLSPVDSRRLFSEQLEYTVQLYFIRLINLDSASQVLDSIIQFQTCWKDPRLVWDPNLYNDIDMIIVSLDDIWIPDAMLGSALEISLALPQNFLNVRIYSNGTVFAPIQMYARTMCALKVNRFPFDEQKCVLPYLLFTHIDFQITIIGALGDSLVRDYAQIGNGEWDLTHIALSNYSYGEGDQKKNVIAFNLFLNRVPQFYVYVIALPCFVLTGLANIGMFWTPNVKEEQMPKLGIGLTTLVSMTVLLDMVAGSIPKTASFPILGIYVTSCNSIIGFGCVIIAATVEIPLETKLVTKNSMPGLQLSSICHEITFFVEKYLVKRHVILHVLLQSVNLGTFIMFLSFW